MKDQIPVVDLELAVSGRAPGGLLDAVRGAAEQIRELGPASEAAAMADATSTRAGTDPG